MGKIPRDATAGVGPQGGGPVDSESASEQTYSVVNRALGDQPSSRDRTERQAAVRVNRMASMTAIALFSAGLWAAIWAAASSLTAVWLK